MNFEYKKKILAIFVMAISVSCQNGIICADATRAEVDTKLIIEKMVAASTPRIYFLSYPRSGNTWVRYCIEVLTQRPTAHFFGLDNISNLPLGLTAGHSLDFSKAPVWKAHVKSELNFAKFKVNPQEDLLIFIVRNPKEVITCHQGNIGLMELLNAEPVGETLNFGYGNPYLYFDDLKIFDSWAANKKILIYYEDLIKKTRETMSQVLFFLGDSLDGLDDFFKNYQKHQNIALNLYEYNGGSQTQGEQVIYHSYKLSAQDRKEVDQWIKRSYPHLWDAYLKDYYAEELLESLGAYNKEN